MSARLVLTVAAVAAVTTPCAFAAGYGLEVMVLDVALRHFPAGGLVVLIEDAAGGDGITNGISQAGRWPVMILSSSYRFSRHLWLLRCRAASFVLVGDEPSISKALGRLRNDVQTWWNNTAHFLLVMPHSGDVVRMHRWMLGFHATNVVIAVAPEIGNQTGVVSLLSVQPPNGVVCNRHSEAATKTDTWIPDNGTFLNDQQQLFAPSQPEACDRCGVLVARATPPAMYSAEGRVFEEVFYTIMRHLGCVLDVVEMPSGLDDIVPMDESDRLPGAYDRVIRGDADVVLRYAWMTQNRSAKLSPTTYLDLQSVEVYVSERFVGLDFPTTLELVVLLVLAVAMAVNHFLLGLRRRFNSGPQHRFMAGRCVPSMLSAWSLFAEQSPAREGKTGAWDRMLWLTLAFGAVNVNTVRRSVYATNAMRPRFAHMTTVEQLVDDHVLVGAHDETIYEVIMGGQKNSNDRVLLLEDCFTDTKQCLRRLPQSEGRFALLLNAPTYYSNLTASERSRVRLLNTPYFLFPVTTYFTKDHPLVKAFSRVSSRLQDAGITRYKFGRSIAADAPRSSRTIAEQPKALKMRDLAPCFNVLLVALPVVLLCFIGELTVKHLPLHIVQGRK